MTDQPNTQNQTQDLNQTPTTASAEVAQTAIEPQEVSETPVPISQIERNASAAKKLRHQTLVLMEVSIILAVGFLLINFLLIYLTNNQVSQYQTNLQQIAAAEYNSTDRQYTVTFLESQKQNTELIQQALPRSKQTDFLEFVQTIELISQESAVQNSLEFRSLITPETGQSFVPFVMTMTTDLVNFAEFLKKTEKLTYLVEIKQIEINPSDVGGQFWNFKLFARIYVDNKFE